MAPQCIPTFTRRILLHLSTQNSRLLKRLVRNSRYPRSVSMNPRFHFSSRIQLSLQLVNSQHHSSVLEFPTSLFNSLHCSYYFPWRPSMTKRAPRGITPSNHTFHRFEQHRSSLLSDYPPSHLHYHSSHSSSPFLANALPHSP